MDVFAALDTPPRRSKGVALPGASIVSLQAALTLLQPVQAVFLDEYEDELTFLRLRRDVFPGETNRTSCGSLSHRLRYFFSLISAAQSRKLGACWDMITAREARHGSKYTHIARVRPDVSFPRALDFSAYLSNATSTIESSSDMCMHQRAAATTDTSQHCYAPCNAIQRTSMPPDVLMAEPFPGMLPAVFVNDHFYLASRRVARPFFDHLEMVGRKRQ